MRTSNHPSRSQIDALGARLRTGEIEIDDLRLLDAYRRSFSEPYQVVVGTIRNEMRHEPTGRPAKSTAAIIDKLRRESIRLRQVQDIAGARIIVNDIQQQDELIIDLERLFPLATIFDRRIRPSHGYRAIHVVVRVEGQPIEVQVRTPLQHLWAEVSEKHLRCCR